MQSTKDVLDHHLKCFGECNLEGTLADYTSDAILFIPTGPLKGIPAIKPVFQPSLQSSENQVLHLSCTSNGLKEILRTSCGPPKQRTITMTLQRIRLWCKVGKSSHKLLLQK